MSTHVCTPNMDVSRDMLTQNRNNPLTTSVVSYSLSSAPSRFFGPGTTPLSDIPPKSSRKNVARNLFGPPDPRSTQYAREKVIEMRDRDIQRWNFDFDKEKPLEGRYKWEAVSIGKEGGGVVRSEDCDVPRPYALSRLLSSGFQSPSASSTSPEGLFPGNLTERESLFIVLKEECGGWGGAAGGTASDVGAGGGSGESEGDDRAPARPPGSSASVGTSLTRSSSQESQSVSSASSQYSFPSPNRSPPVQIDPLTIPIPSPPEDCSSSSSSSTSDCLNLVEGTTTSLQHHEAKLTFKNRPPKKQKTLKDYLPVKRRSSSQTTGAPEKKAAM